MDVFITPEARQEMEALRVFRMKAGTWGVLVGHRRGFRFIVEKILMAGSAETLPDERLLEGLDGVWPGRTIGLIAVRPGVAFRKAVRGPAWYGKLVLEISGTAGKPALRPAVVEFEKRFFFSPVLLAPARKRRSHE